MWFAPFGDAFSLLMVVRRFHDLRSFHQRLLKVGPLRGPEVTCETWTSKRTCQIKIAREPSLVSTFLMPNQGVPKSTWWFGSSNARDSWNCFRQKVTRVATSCLLRGKRSWFLNIWGIRKGSPNFFHVFLDFFCESSRKFRVSRKKAVSLHRNSEGDASTGELLKLN